jgi:hypothetical protein
MNRVQSPPCAESLLNLVPSASGPAGEFDAVDDDRRLEFFPQLKFQLCEVRDDRGQEIWIPEVYNMFKARAAWAGCIAGDRGDDEDVEVLKLIDCPLELVDSELKGPLRCHH